MSSTTFNSGTSYTSHVYALPQEEIKDQAVCLIWHYKNDYPKELIWL